MVTKKQNLSRRDFIKAATTFVASLIGVAIGLPSIAYLLSPSLRKTENDSLIDLGPLNKYPLGIPTLFEFTRTKVNGWERTGLNYAYLFCARPRKMGACSRIFVPILLVKSRGILINSITSVPAMTGTSIFRAIT